MITDTVRPGPHIHMHTVIHAQCDRMPSRREAAAQVVEVRRGQAVVGADEPVIHPQARFPMSPLKREHDALA